MPSAEHWTEFLERFQPDPGFGVYVLGSYAKYATLYSQQVRALNLIAALWDTKRLRAGTDVAVIGGGAAGLTASAAAAVLGANVTLLERLEGLMELQRNNRQRWLHPHIYDWPLPDDPSDRARLPILDWEAGYSEHVAYQIEEAWRQIQKRTRLESFVGCQQVGLEKAKGVPYVSWSGGDIPRPFPVVVLAVGFGLEPSTIGRWSYWEEDSIDAGLLRQSGRTWLVSGYGDSALTDLMRLCIRRFRHAELPILFSNRGEALDMIKRDLLDIDRDERASDPEFLTRRFGQLETGHLHEELRSRLRTNIRVHLTGDGPFRYQPRASLLNRLMLRLLTKLDAYDYIPGKVLGKVQPDLDRDGYIVPLQHSGAKFFNHVILRHAPEPALATSFQDIEAAAAQTLRGLWNFTTARVDTTRRRQWSPQNLFAKRQVPESLAKQEPFQRLGVGIGTLTVRKELWSDGRALITYRIDDLFVQSGQVDNIRIWMQSNVGKVGRPQFDAQGQQLELTWIADPEVATPLHAPFEEHLQATRDRVRRISGVIHFPEAITSAISPVSFSLSIPELNADALTVWQFEQFYAEPDRTHIDQKPVVELEFFARIGWPPVGTMLVQLALPSEYDVEPTVSEFQCPLNIPSDAVLNGTEVHLSPPPGSPLSPARTAWDRVDTDRMPEKIYVGGTPVWQLTVEQPIRGHAYSLDWRVKQLPLDPDFELLADHADFFRQKLLEHRERRLSGDAGGSARDAVIEFARKIRRQFGDRRAEERLEVTVLTYNQGKRVLEVIEGTVDEGEPAPTIWAFRLPFGLGLAGAAFKSARAQLYVAPDTEGQAEAENFLDLPASRPLKGLVALPLDHPGFQGASQQTDRSRQVVAVIDIASNLPNSQLVTSLRELALRDDPRERLGTLPDLARELRDKLYLTLC